MDNTLVQHMECKVRGKEAKITLKIDVSKSFDKVDWKYLNAILLQMGFDVTWVNWMKLCVETKKVERIREESREIFLLIPYLVWSKEKIFLVVL